MNGVCTRGTGSLHHLRLAGQDLPDGSFLANNLDRTVAFARYGAQFEICRG